MKLRRIPVGLLAGIMTATISFVPASAENSFDISYIRKKGNIAECTVVTSDKSAQTPVVVSVILADNSTNPESGTISHGYTGDIENALYIDRIFSGEDGTCKFTFTYPESGGCFRIFASDGHNEGYTDLTALTPAQIGDIIKAIENKDVDSVRNYVTNLREGLDIDTSVSSSLSEPDKVYDIMVAGGVDEASIAEINKLYYTSVYTAMYNEANEKETTLLKINDEPFADASEEATLFKSALEENDSDIRSAVINGVKSEYSSFDELENDVERLWLINRIAKAELHTQIESALKDYAVKLGINTDNVSVNVYKAMIKQNYNTFDEVKNAFNTLKSNTNAGGGSSGGTGGGGGGAVIPSTGTSDMATGATPPGTTSGNNVSNQSVNKQEIVGKNVFPDMENHLWAAEAVTYLYNKGIVSGDEKGYFNPEKNVSRKEAVKLIAMLAIPDEIDMSVTSGLSFKDLKWDDWSYPYVAAAVKKGLINGRNEDEFAPDDTVTREELAVIAWNVMKMRGAAERESNSSFMDFQSVSDWAKISVASLDYHHIVSGMTTDDGYVFAPKYFANRAETAMIIYNIAKAE